MVSASAGVQTDLLSGSLLMWTYLPLLRTTKFPLFISPVPDQHAWDIDALNIVWLGLTAYPYPSMALLHNVIQNWATPLPHYCNSPRLARDALVVGPSAALKGDPTPITSVNNTSQQSSNEVFHNNPQFLNLHTWCLGVANSKNKSPLWKGQRELGPLIVSQPEPIKWALYERWCRDNSVVFSSPTVKQIPDFSCICTKI